MTHQQSHSLLFFFSCSAHHRDLHSFPTRRSSDLFQGSNAPRGRVRDVERLPAELNPPALVHDERLDFMLRSGLDRKSTRLNSSHMSISYAVFCLKKKKMTTQKSDFLVG